MKNSWMNNKKMKRIITVVVAIAVMVGMVVPTVAMESGETAADVLTAEEILLEESGQPAEEDEGEKPSKESGQQGDTGQEETDKTESRADEETTPEQENIPPIQDESVKKDAGDATKEQKQEVNPLFSLDETKLLAPVLPSTDVFAPFDLIDPDETLIYPGVKVIWYNKNGTETSAPAGASITVVLMDKGPQDSYPDWVPSQNRLGTSKNTEVLNAANGFDGWFDNIIKMRSKKLVVSGVPSGYTVTYDDNSTSNEYPAGYDPEYFYINLTKSDSAPVTLSKIEVTTAPSKTVYTAGESFSKAGMVVKATYSDGSSKVVTSYTYSPTGALAAGVSQITISYEEGGVQKTTTTPITVNAAPVPVLDSIEVTAQPTKTAYTVGDTFDPAGLEVTAHYTNGGADKVLTSGEYTLSAPDMNTPGTKSIVVTYQGKTASFDITVEMAAPELSSIVVTKNPTKTTYTVGDTFDPAGLEVTAYYTNDGADKVLTSGEYTLSTPDMSAAGTKTITVTYEEDGIEKTATFDITVNAPAPVLDSIEVTEQPTKTIYTVGDTFDAAGLEVTAHYTNGGADKILTSGEYTLSAPDMGTAGTKTVTVTYEESGIEKTATFSITVNAPAPVLDSIEVTENPTKTTYTVGDTFNPSGLEVTAHYTNGGADKVLTSGEYTLSTPDMSTSGTKTITVTYEEDGVEKTATFDITVNAPVPVLDSIEVTENPTQTTYTVGDTFDAAGLEVTAHYTNGGADKVLTSGEYTLSTPDMSVAGTKTITVTYEEDGVEKTATFNITVNALVPVLDSIEVTEQPTKTTYTVGDTFNPSGLEVTAHYTNGGADKVLTSGEYTLSAPDMGTSGTKTVTVTYEEDGVEKTASFDITVNAPAPVLDSIEVTEQPTKTTYTVGDTFDAAGLEVTAHYTNGGVDKMLTSGEYTLSAPDMGTSGTKTVTVTYEEDGVEKTATFDITVNALVPVLDSIEVTAQPTKTIYTVGDTFDAAGLEVTAHYTNGGADKILTSGEYTLSAPDMSTAGTKTITVTYEESGIEKTATFDITVNAPVPVLDSIEVTEQPTKTIYTVGDTFDAAGLEVTAHYTNGGADKVLTSGEYTLSTPDMSTSGTKTITVTYEEDGVEKTASFDITVNAPAPVLDSIEVTENPTKITYTVGDIFSPAGLEVTARYTNGGADKVLMSGEYTLSTPDMSAAGTKTITVTYEEDGVEKTATFDITVNAPVPVLDSIEVTEQPTKTTYTVGDTFDAAGLEVTAHYTNGGADKVLTSGEYTLSAPDMGTSGTKTVTVTYEEDGVEKTATFDITVNALVPVLDSIEVTENPTKTTYTVGDTFDAAGLEITAHYTNGGADKVLTSGEYTLSTPDMSAAGTKMITVTYEEDGIEKTATFDITVNAPAPVLDSIEVTAQPTKTIYTVGDTFDAAGLEVTAHYTNGGADKVLTSGEYTLSTPDMSTAGTKTVTVTYEEDGVEKTATFDITVNALVPVLDMIEITKQPVKTAYTVGDAFDPTGLEVKAHYTNGGAHRVLGDHEYALSAPDMSTSGTKTVTVTYEENGVQKTDTFDIVLADAVTPTPTPDPTVSPEPSAGAEPVAGVTDDDNTGNGGEHDSMPKTGVEDTTPAMMVLLAIAALMTVILFAQLMKKENTMIRNGEGAIGTREKFGRRIRNKVLGKVLGIVLAVELHKETTGKQSKK